MRTLRDLRDEMRSVARGESAPPAAPTAGPDAVAGVLGVLTPANLALMNLIATRRPESVSRLADLCGRSQPNVSRSLQELAKRGLVRLVRDGMAIRPELAVGAIDIDLASGTFSVSSYVAPAE